MNTLSRLVIALLVLTITGCTQVKRAPQQNNVAIVGSGNIVSQARSLSGFDRLEAGLIFDLVVRQGDEFRVEFIADDNWVDFLAAEVDGTTLILDLKDGYAYNFSNVTMRAEVTMPELAGLNLNGSSRAHIEGFQSVESFQATLTGSSFLGGELIAQKTSLGIYGNSTARLFGSSEALFLEACGSSVVDLRNFQVENAEIDMACSSSTIVNVGGRLDVEAAQHSQVFYLGAPGSGVINVYESASVGRYRE